MNEKVKEIVQKLFDNIVDWAVINAESTCFITTEVRRENFLKHSKVCLISPGKNELGRRSKIILDNIYKKLFEVAKIDQWKNTVSTIKWFNLRKEKHLMKLVFFFIKDF